MDKFDFKKEFKRLYLPKTEPHLVEVPPMTFIAVEGKGNPNDDTGEYSEAVGLLYALSYTIKMSYKGGRAIDGYFEYVVLPLEGLWWSEDGKLEIDFSDKSLFRWVSMIRQPEFVTEDVFRWACEEVAIKKKLDTSRAKLLQYDEGLCVQCMHIGSYDDEPATVSKMNAFMHQHGYRFDDSGIRRHHEIYLGDPRKTAPEMLKTVIRHPVTSV